MTPLDALRERLTRVAPIELTYNQQKAATQWAADDRLWTTQETVEFNLRVFARAILKHEWDHILAIVEPWARAQQEQIDKPHGPTIKQQQATVADHYGHGWMAGADSIQALRAKLEAAEAEIALVRRRCEDPEHPDEVAEDVLALLQTERL